LSRRSLFVWLFLSLAVRAGAQAILILPFENHGRNSALDWIGESAAEGLAANWRLPQHVAPRSTPGDTRYVIRREERVAAYEQLGLPPSVALTHATVIKIGEVTGADLLVFGTFEGDAQHLTLSARVLGMRTPRLQAPCQESGRLAELLTIQDRLATDLASTAGFAGAARSSVGTVSLEAWEVYVRGLTAGPSPQQFKYFREATRLDPGFAPASFQLGRISFQNKEYPDALLWLEKIGPDDANYLEARFLAGISSYHLRQWEKAESAFLTVTATLPLNEAFNNLGVVQAKERKRAAALESLQKALEGDPDDPDYLYNLACFYLRAGDYAQAARRLKEVLSKRPSDAEAKALLVNAQQENPAEPPERLKYNFEGPSFRQLRMTLERMADEKNGGSDASRGAPSPAALHLSRGRELVEQHQDAAAVREFNEVIMLDPSSVQAYLELARLHLHNGRTGQAEDAARRAADNNRDKKDPEAYLLLAKIYQDQGKMDQAREALKQALQRDPDNVAARELERQIKVKPE
jgi:Tfp pilus assembly protein PilF